MQISRRFMSCLAALSLLPAAAAAQQGVVTGRVTDRGTSQPIANAQVNIEGTKRGTVTDENGHYRIGSVTPGTITLRVLRIGYESATRTVTVTADAPATADFALSVRAVSLDETVVLATGATERVRESGIATGKLRVDSLAMANVKTASDMLQSRVAGVTVMPSSGTAGGNARVRIRGSNSLSLSNDPLVIIDGVRVNGSLSSSTIGVGGQSPSRLNDLNPEDIENIEVVKGPAAASLYGTAAANGVLYITTKRGRSGTAQWTTHVEGGAVDRITTFPANYQQMGTIVATNTTGTCRNDAYTRGLCTPTDLRSWNPLESKDPEIGPFQNGNTQNYGLSLKGGADRATYYLSGQWAKDQGIVSWNQFSRTNLRANIQTQPRDNMNFGANVGYVQSRLRLPQNDNNVLGILGGGLLGAAQDLPESHGYYLGQSVVEIGAIDTRQNVDRFTGSVNGDWQMLPWLSIRSIAGLDFTNRIDQELVPPDKVQFADLPEGQRTSNPYQQFYYTMNSGASAQFGLTPSIKSTTTVGVSYNSEIVRGTEAFGQMLLPGTGSLKGTSYLYSVDETNSENITLGGYLQQQFGWRDRVFVNAAVRADKNSAFGQDFKSIYYPSANLSWVLGDESFFPRTQVLSSLRLRTAFGESGQRPGVHDAVKYFTPVSIAVEEGEAPGFVVGGVGNAKLKAERSREYELGFDAGLLSERVSLSLTYYNKNTSDALVSVPLPPSNGEGNNQWRNLGKVKNSGLEVLLNADVLNADPVRWTLGVNASTNNNKVVDLGVDAVGNPIKPIVVSTQQQHRNDYPLGGYWQRPIVSYSDANGDGLISRTEVQLGPDMVYLGSPFPKTEVTFNTSLTMFKYFRLNGLLDHRGGLKLFNNTERFRCVSSGNCRAANDPSAPLADQAAYIAGLMGTDAGYIEDASFWKLRELSLTLLAPRDFAARMGASAVSLSFGGRNLATWKKYKGFDPEVVSAATSNFATADFLTMPPNRYYTVRMDITW